MLDIISRLFEANGFNGKKIADGFVYCHGKRCEYWIVVKSEISKIIDSQSDYFQQCKKAFPDDESLDKNISMLVLWETDKTVESDGFRKTKMEIEENPFYFKKYVLAYSTEQLQGLQKELGDKQISLFIKEVLGSKDIFDVYKSKIKEHTWHSLVYRMAIKLPFVEVPIKQSEGLQSLVQQNDSTLQNKKLKAYRDEYVSAIIDKMSIDGIKEMGPKELCAKLNFDEASK